MAGDPQQRPLFEPANARARMALRRRKYLRRRIIALAILAGLLAGLFYGARWLANRWRSRPATPVSAAATATTPLPFQADKFLTVETGNDAALYVALGPATDSLREIALTTGSQKAPKMIGQPVTVADFALKVVDLPQARGVLVLYQQLPARGPAKAVPVGGEQAMEAAGGEPDYQAWQLDKTNGLVPVDYYRLAAPVTPPAPNAIVVDKFLNALWYYENGQLTQTYRVATGKFLTGPAITAANQAKNMLTPLGSFTIVNKYPGLPYYKENIKAGDPRNPLGTRWMGFSVFPGDGAMFWAIHGTNEPASVGQWASEGCIRLKNADLEQLYERVKVGTVLQIVSSEGK